MPTTLLRRAHIVHTDVTEPADEVDAVPSDVLIVDGRIDRIAPTIDPDGPVDDEIDLGGRLLLPAAVEPHAHLDKAFLAERIDNRTGDLRGALEAMIDLAGRVDVADIEQRAERAARRMAANGYVAVRTHVDVTVHTGMDHVEALTAVRDRLRNVIDIEIVALTGHPVVGVEGTSHRALLREALDLGADLVGGCPHLEPDGTVAEATAVLLEIAADVGVPVDLHTDETLDPDVVGLRQLAEQVLAGFPHPATASHCVSLGQQPLDEQRRTADSVAEAGIAVVTLPQTNLWLGGRDRHPVPRGLTAIGALRAAGVTVAAGADNLQDPFNPLGRACPFETAALMVLAAHDLPHTAWATVSGDAARVLRRGGGRVEPGAPADLLAVPADSLRQAIAEAPDDRVVLRSAD